MATDPCIPGFGGRHRLSGAWRRGRAHALPWTRLLRLPNLPTVPGDPLAGFMLARLAVPEAAPAAGSAVSAAAAALLMYGFGLLHNDLVDREVDRRERPDRPIPSGQVRLPAVRRAALGLALAGWACARVSGAWVFGAAVLLTLLVWLYNAVLKRRALAGPLAMGLCRGLSVLLGALAGGWRGGRPPDDPVVVGAAGVALYIAAVTWVARDEADAGNAFPIPARKRWGPVLALAVLFALLIRLRTPAPAAALLAAGALAWGAGTAVALQRASATEAVASAVGRWIRGLLPVQGALFAWGGGAGGGSLVVVGLAWGLSTILARKVYAS